MLQILVYLSLAYIVHSLEHVISLGDHIGFTKTGFINAMCIISLIAA